ncbi:MAG TPA: hypothetical protein VF691_04885 [Cytophagaceae bacterium]
MENINQEVTTSKDLKLYISFLKAEKLDEIIPEVIRLSYEYQLPAMKQLEGVRAETIYHLTALGITDFFNDIIEGKPIEGLLRALDDWKNRKVGTEIKSLSYEDIVTGYLIRKQVLIQKIQEYTQDSLLYITWYKN